jgi:hypothetical protein
MIKNLFGLAAATLLVACVQTAQPEPARRVEPAAFDENDALTKYEEAYAMAMERCLDLRGDERKACLKEARLEARRAVSRSKK